MSCVEIKLNEIYIVVVAFSRGNEHTGQKVCVKGLSNGIFGSFKPIPSHQFQLGNTFCSLKNCYFIIIVVVGFLSLKHQ